MGRLHKRFLSVKGDSSLIQAQSFGFAREDAALNGPTRDHSLSHWGFKPIAITAALGALAGCQPTVRVEAPKEPITINLNVKLDAEVRLKLEEQAREEVEANPDIF